VRKLTKRDRLLSQLFEVKYFAFFEYTFYRCELLVSTTFYNE